MKILMVCLGNICRSPMAEFLLREMAFARGIDVSVQSAATCDSEEGNGVHYGTRSVLQARGIDCSHKRSRPLTAADYDKFDLLIGMEERNLRAMRRICGGDPDGKIKRLLDYTDHPRDIADPWYTGDFAATERDVEEGCGALLDALARSRFR